MKRIFLTVLGIAALVRSFAQLPDSSFQSRKLKIEEINLVSSYYGQNGDHAAVTGGIGTQQLTDLANVFDIKLTKYDHRLRKHSFDVEVAGIIKTTGALAPTR